MQVTDRGRAVAAVTEVNVGPAQSSPLRCVGGLAGAGRGTQDRQKYQHQRGLRLGDCAAPRGGLHPDTPGAGADREAAPGVHPGARRLAGRPPSAAREPGRGGAGPEACWSGSMAIPIIIPCARRTCLPVSTGDERPGRGAARQPCRASRPLTPVIRAERLRFGEHGVLELLRDASLDHLLGRDFDGFPGCWVTTGPRFALLQDELRDAG